MLATADCTNHYPEQTVYDSEWAENISSGISWRNLLTSQTIPEETDTPEDPGTPVRSRKVSNCSTSSIESCYVVLEIQRQCLTHETPSKIEVIDKKEDKTDEDEDKEEVEIEEINFAQMNTDNQDFTYEEVAEPLTPEVELIRFIASNILFLSRHLRGNTLLNVDKNEFFLLQNMLT